MLRDLHHAFRTLRARPAFAAVAVLALALGIGVNTAVFSVIDTVLLRALPIADAERLLSLVKTRVDRGGHYGVRYPDFLDWRQAAHSFESWTVLHRRTFVLRGSEDGERIAGSEVDAAFFKTLGVEPVLGRAWSVEEVRADERLALVSHGFWQSRLGGDPGVLGSELVLDGEPHTLIGVMPPAAALPYVGWREVLTPLPRGVEEEERWYFTVLARLADGVELDDARRDLEAVAARQAAESPATHEGWSVEMHPIEWWIFGSVRQPLVLVYAVAVLVLLIAGGTVSNLGFSRAAARQQDVAVRKALGAPRAVLLRQLLAESFVLTLFGGLGGAVLAAFVLRTLPSLGPDLPRVAEVGLDPRTLLAMVVAAFVVGMGSGVAPAFSLLRVPLEALRGTRGTAARGRRRLRRFLVLAETALAVLAVIGAGLLLRSFAELRAVDPGFEPDRLLTLRVELAADLHPEPAARITAFEDLLDRLESLPGVDAAGAAAFGLPLKDLQSTFELYVEGRPRRARPDVTVVAQAASPGYLETMGIEVVRGRSFRPGETWDSDRAVIVNETLAQRSWPDQDPIGRWVEWQTGDRGRVVGVVEDVRQARLHLDSSAQAYIAWGLAPTTQYLVLRAATADAGALVPAIRHEVTARLPGALVDDVTTGTEIVRSSYADRRLWMLLMTAFAGLAVVLGLIGFYGVVAHSVADRRREIGIRMALGAWPAVVRRLVLRQGLEPVLGGVGVGLGLALALSHVLDSQLYGVTSRDPWTFVIGVALILVTAGAVCALPAARAARLEASVAVRDQPET